MGRIWSDQRRYETWLLVENRRRRRHGEPPASCRPRLPATSAERGGFDIARIEEIEQIDPARRHRLHDRGRRESRTVGALAALRADLVGRHRHRAGAADARGLRPDPRRISTGCCEAIRDRALEASADADDRPHARRARRADDVRSEAGALARRGRARRRARAARARATVSVGKLSGAVGTFAHLPPSIEADVCQRLGLAPAPVAVAGDPARSPRRS